MLRFRVETDDELVEHGDEEVFVIVAAQLAGVGTHRVGGRGVQETVHSAQHRLG